MSAVRSIAVACLFVASAAHSVSANSVTKQDAERVGRVADQWSAVYTDIVSALLLMRAAKQDIDCINGVSHEVNETALFVASVQFLTSTSALMRHEDDERIALFMTMRAISATNDMIVRARTILNGWLITCRDDPMTVQKVGAAMRLVEETAALLRYLQTRIPVRE
jgi:hypothetical protein